MKGKNGVKLADFIREIINTKISEKPVKSRIFENFEGIRENKKSPSETSPKRKVGGSNPFWRARKGQISLEICPFQLNPPLRVGETLLRNMKYAFSV